LEDRKKVSRCTTNDPELFISPPILNGYPTPPQLKNASGSNGHEEQDEPHAGKVANLQRMHQEQIQQISVGRTKPKFQINYN